MEQTQGWGTRHHSSRSSRAGMERWLRVKCRPTRRANLKAGLLQHAQPRYSSTGTTSTNLHGPYHLLILCEVLQAWHAVDPLVSGYDQLQQRMADPVAGPEQFPLIHRRAGGAWGRERRTGRVGGGGCVVGGGEGGQGKKND